MRQIGRDPIFIERGEGCDIWDVDGNRYVDWVCSWGPLILGHADPAVVEAVGEAAERGTSYGAATAAEVELAREVTDALLGVEMVRMTSSGTEATMTALRLARAITGRARSSSSPAPTTATSTACSPTPAPGLATRASPPAPASPRRRPRTP